MKIVFKLVAITMVLAWLATDADAQQAGRVYRIGYINNAAGGSARRTKRFRKRLQELGYGEGQNLTIEWQFAKGDRDQYQRLVAELVDRRVDCIVAGGVAFTRLSKQATDTIPIVMSNADDDPVQQGLVASLARPGGNVTGFINIGSDLAGKRLELLKEVVPKATRMAIICSGGEGAAGHIRESQAVAPAWGIRLQSVEVPSPDASGIERDKNSW